MAKRLLARVKSRRLTLGLSQEAFAEKVGLGYKYYQSVEAARRRDLRLSTLEKLAKGCDLKLWQLLNFDAEPPAPADDAPAKGSQTPPAKSAPKSPKRRSPSKRA
jgi:transcriptional regulator with XRE-family HTH domain